MEFDGILVGYLSDPQQAEGVLELISAFDCPVILDPVMGDHGKCYSGITRDHTDALRDLSGLARVLLPNVTEAALLTGLPYQETADPAYFRQLLAGLETFGAKHVILTGVSLEEGKLGCFGKDAQGEFFCQNEKVQRSCHGTGDLFAAVVAGAMTRGKQCRDAATLAAEFTRLVVENTPQPTPFGTEFEKCLPFLWQNL